MATDISPEIFTFPVITAIMEFKSPFKIEVNVSSVVEIVQSESKFSLDTDPSAPTTMIPPGKANLKDTPWPPFWAAKAIIRSLIS